MQTLTRHSRQTLGTNCWCVVAMLLLTANVAAVPCRAKPDSLDGSPALHLSSPDIADTMVSDLVSVGTDALTLFSSPSRFDVVDWAIAGGVVTATGLAMPLDDDIRDIAQRNRSTAGNDASLIGNSFGTIVPAVGITGVLYITGLAFDLPAVRRSGLHVGQSLLYAGVMTAVLKAVIGRQRPDAGGGQYVFDSFTLNDRFHALPSGHTSAAFAMASSLAADIDHPAATVALYGLATFTAASRVYDNRHWTSDVILGAAIGTACGYAVANMDSGGSGGSSFMIIPSTERLSIVWKFR